MTVPVHFHSLSDNPSTFLLFYMSTYIPVHNHICSVYYFLFCVTCAMTFQLIYWDTYPQIHPKMNVPVYKVHALLSPNHKDLPAPQLFLYLPKDVPVHGPICSFSYFHSDEPFRSTRQRFYCSTRPQMYLFITIPIQFISSFSA